LFQEQQRGASLITTSANRKILPQAVALILLSIFTGFAPVLLRAQLSTYDHLTEPGWWPRREPTSSKEFVGNAACATCHATITASQKTTAMARTLMPAATAEVLHSRMDLSFRNGKYLYEIKTKGAAPELTVTEGEHTIAADLLWAFGTGRLGQSYLFLRGSKYRESRMTYFSSLKNLGFTPTRALLSPHDLEEAESRPVDIDEVRRCFGCHSFGANVAGKLDTSKASPGVTCEACHAPGLNHVLTMEFNQSDDRYSDEEGRKLIFNPGRLSPSDSVDFCGSCHGTWMDVKLAGTRGISNVRMQPYRLMSSKCWGTEDKRLACIACHDPHKPLSTDAAVYDSKCLDCHVNSPAARATKDHPGAACPVGTKECTNCHMPKIEIPEMHTSFADHLIRVVRPGAPVPD
jgi:hypothetical protein